MRYIILVLLTTYSLVGQMFPFPGPGLPNLAPGGLWDLTPIAHGATSGNATSHLTSVGPLNCTGATSYFLASSVFGAGADTLAPTYNDGSSHAFTLHSGAGISGAGNTVAWYWAQGITGSSSVTFSATTNYGPVWALCWKQGAASGMKDQESVTGALGCYGCTPTITPTANNTLVLVIASAEGGVTNVQDTNGYYTGIDALDFIGSVSEGGEVLYRVFVGVLASGTYTSGITAVGLLSSTCTLTSFNGGGSGAVATIQLTGINTIAPGTPILISNTGHNFTSAPTTATVGSGTATCTGTPVLSTVIGGGSGAVEMIQLTNPAGPGTAKAVNFIHQ